MKKVIRWALLAGFMIVVGLTAVLVVLKTGFIQQKQALPIPPVNQTVLTPTKATPRILTLGYYTGQQNSYDAVAAFASQLSIVSVDVFGVQMDGSIAGGDELGLAAYARTQSIRTYACIGNYNSDPAINDFDPALAHAVVGPYKAVLIEGLVNLAREGGYEGINIDFENLAYSENIIEDRTAFSTFIQELADALHANGFKLMVSVPGKTEDAIENTWAYPFDLASLGRNADYLQLMTYDQHGTWSEPGPISGADWVEECLNYTSSIVEPGKLFIGLPAYGYDWDLSASDPAQGVYSALSFSWMDIPALLAKPGSVVHWDLASRSPSVTYSENGHEHEAWYETPESIRAKVELIAKYNLAGLSFWSLGQEDQSFWNAVRDSIKQ